MEKRTKAERGTIAYLLPLRRNMLTLFSMRRKRYEENAAFVHNSKKKKEVEETPLVGQTLVFPLIFF